MGLLEGETDEMLGSEEGSFDALTEGLTDKLASNVGSTVGWIVGILGKEGLDDGPSKNKGSAERVSEGEIVGSHEGTLEIVGAIVEEGNSEGYILGSEDGR